MINTWYKSNPKGWTLISGIWSPFYINLRDISSFPQILKKIGNALSQIIINECENINRIIGIASAGIPIAVSISFHTNLPMCYTRKLEGIRSVEEFELKIKKYGQHNLIEGVLKEGDNIAFIDDLVTKLDSKLIAIEQLKHESKERKVKINYKDIIVVLDREQGAAELAKKRNLNIKSLIPFKSKGIKWLRDKLSEIEFEILSDYLKNVKKYQNQDIQREIRDLID